MSCDPPTSISYLTRLSTIYSDVLTTLTSLEPVPWAARTTDGVVRTPVRTVTAVRYVEVASVVQRVEERTIVGVCTPTPTPTPTRDPVPSASPTTAVVESSSGAKEEEAVPSSSTVPSMVVPPSEARQPEASSTSTNRLPPSASSRTTSTLARTTGPTSSSSLDVVRPFSVPSSSPTPAPISTSILPQLPTTSTLSSSASSSSYTSYDNTTGLFSASTDIVEDRPLAQGAIGGLAAGGLVVFALVLLGVWWAQRRSTKGSESEGEGQGEGRKGSWPWVERLSGGQAPKDGPGSGKKGEEVEEKDYSYLPHPRPYPVHTTSSSSVPSTSTTSIAKSDPRTSRSTAPPTPINPYPSTRPYSSAPAAQPNIRRAIVSPTPATLDKERTQTRLGSMWSRMSGLGWQMGLWGGDTSAVGIDFSAPPQALSSGTKEKDEGMLDILSGSEREGRIPSMVDLRSFGRTLSVIEDHGDPGSGAGLRPKASHSTLSDGDRLSVPSHAPARPSSEYTRGEDEVNALASAGLSPLPPPVPIRVDAVGMSTFPGLGLGARAGMKGKDGKRVSPLAKSKRRSSLALEVGMAGMASPIRATGGPAGRVLAGHKRLSGSSSSPTTTRLPSPRTPSKAAPPRPAKSTSRLAPLIYPQPHSHPSPGSSRTPSPPSRTKRVPPTLNFAKEVTMGHLWIDDGANIAAFNPESATRPLPPGEALLSAGPMLSAFGFEQPGGERRGSVSSAYDGMTEVDVTPLAYRAGLGVGCGGLGSGAGNGRGVKPGEIFDYAQIGSARSSSLGALGSGKISSGMGMGKRPVVLAGGKGLRGEERGEMGIV